MSGGVPPEGPGGAAGNGRHALDNAHAVFRRWFGEEYDLDVFNAVAAAAAAERLDGDPLWLLVIGGPGTAKTEIVQALTGADAIVISTISSEAGLLSATPKTERAGDASGGLLRALGERGLLVVKDFTSILSMDRRLRARVLAAFREIHDGHWLRVVGSEGGRTFRWEGRVGIIGAVTTEWDHKYSVIAAMGDRFVCIRVGSTVGRVAAGRHAISNLGTEESMRDQLATATRAVLAGVDASQPIEVSSDEAEQLLAAANLVTLARTAAVRNTAGYVLDVHDPEMPTRFVKQITQLMRGAVAIGLRRDRALELAMRCARESIPPRRLAILDDVAANAPTPVHEVCERLRKSRTTVERELEALYLLRLLDREEEQLGAGGTSRWHYTIAEDIDMSVLHVETD